MIVNSCTNPEQDKEKYAQSFVLNLSESTEFTFRNWMQAGLKNKEILGFEADSACKEAIGRVYQSTNGVPLWLHRDGSVPLFDQWINVLSDLDADGLDSSDYFITTIRHAQHVLKKGHSLPDSAAFRLELLLTGSFIKLSTDMVYGTHAGLIRRKEWKNRNDSLSDPVSRLIEAVKNAQLAEVIHNLRPQHREYDLFRNEYIRLRTIEKKGGWPVTPLMTDSAWRTAGSSNILNLRKRLHTELGIPNDTTSSRWSDDLVEAIGRFQFLNDLKQSNRLDSATVCSMNTGVKEKMRKLRLNMERMRWLEKSFHQPYILVNVPGMELKLFDHDSIAYTMRVVVGRPSRPTTTLDAKLQNIVFNPPWTVPPTIMKEDVLPGMARRGAAYLRRKGLKAYDLNGKRVAPSLINRANFTQYRIGQAPGYNSSLGEVKFNLRNPWSIYLHDTPHREDFQKRNRALSSGCIRVHHPKEFAALLLADSTKYSLTKIDSICSTRKTTYVNTPEEIIVHIVYLTNATDSAGRMMYLNDIYHWDKKN